MNRWTVLLSTILVTALMIIGCSRSTDNPISPGIDPAITLHSSQSAHSQTHLWGYWDVHIDIESGEIEIIPNRELMFTANVTNFLNGNPTGMSFDINETVPGPDYIDVDIDVTLTHPFPGFQEYNGYDVRGVFMGNGSGSMHHDGNLTYAVNGPDQFMLADPFQTTETWGAPDGYTRWFNITEFSESGMALLSYTPGKLATPGFHGSATLNPYKYFADGLGVTDDLWEWLNAHADQDGRFASGASNTRNYYLRFPNTAGVTYGYAVIANWEGTEQDYHPSNAVEAVTCIADVTPDLYYVDDTDNGGDIIADVSIFGWNYQPSAILIESTVLSSYAELTPAEMVPVGGTENYSTYHFEMESDNITGLDDQDFWVIAQYDNFDYSNDYGVPNLAESDVLSAFFRFDLEISPESLCNDWVPVINTLNGESEYLAVTRPYTGWTIEGDYFEGSAIEVAVSDGTTDVATATDVVIVDQQNLLFDIDLSEVPIGTYDIVVTNGCGAMESAVAEDMLTVLKWIYPVGDTNLDVVSDYTTPKDITVDPSSDQTGIAYEDKYWVNWSDNYTTDSGQLNTWWNTFIGSRVEIGVFDSQPSLIYYSHETSPWYPGQYMCWSWCDYTGWQSTHSQWQPQTGNVLYDMANIQGTDEIRMIFNWFGQGFSSVGTDADYHIFTWYHSHLGDPSFYGGTGDTGVVPDNLVAIDFAEWDGSNYDMYILEEIPATDTGVVELWRFHYNPTLLDSFGEGIISSPLDITVDSSYNAYVLEETDEGYPLIRAWDSNGEMIGFSEPIESDVISGAALRLDAALSADPDEVHVLHEDGVTRFSM